MKYPCKQQIANKLLSKVYKHKCFQGPGLQDKQMSELVKYKQCGVLGLGQTGEQCLSKWGTKHSGLIVIN